MTVWGGKPAIALRYTLAPACVGVGVLLYLSPAGSLLHPTGPFVLGVVAAAWFGGAGPGVLAAFLSALVFPQLVVVTGSLSTSYPLLGGFFDLPRFLSLGLTGAAVGWGTSSYRRAQAALRERERLLIKARDELEIAVAERTAHLSASEEALRESEKRYERVMLASNAGVWDWDVTTDKYYVSPQFLELCGMPPGATFSTREEFIRSRPIYPDDREKWEQAVRTLFASRDARVAMEVRSIVNGESRWRRLEGMCFRDATGRVVRWTGTSTDITDRKLAEEALRQSEERFALAVAGSNDGIWDWDVVTDNMFLSARAQRIYGLEPGVIVRPRAQWRAMVVLHPEDVEPQRRAIEDYLAGTQDDYEGEWRVRDADGAFRWVRIRGQCVRDAGGRVTRFAGSVSDIDVHKRAEEALRLSEERHAIAMQASGAGHWDWKIATDEYHVSPRMRELAGIAPDATWASRAEYLALFPFHPEDRPRFEAAVAAHFAGKAARFDIEVRLVPGGDVRWIHMLGICIRDPSGAPARWAGSVIDITERKRAEEALRRSEQRYALAMEAAGDGHTDWNLETGEFYISPRLLKILGYAPGTTFADRADWVRRFPFHPEDRRRWEAAVAAHFAGREAKFSMDLRIVVNGETRWVAFTFIASRDASGKPVRWTGSIADINDAKLAEEALRESQERYALAVAGSDDGVWDCDFVARHVFVSPRARELAGMPPGPEMVPMDEWFASLPIHPEDLPRRLAAMQAHLAGKTPAYEGEFRLRQPDGTYRWRRLHGLCLRNADGNPHRMAGSISDIDVRRRAEEALRLSEERYALALEASEEGHFDNDLQANEIFVSARVNEIYGFPRQARTLNRIEFLNQIPFHPDDRHVLAELSRLDWQDPPGDLYEIECRIVPRPGETRWIHSRAKVVRDAEGRPRRRVGVVADITERKLAAEALRVSEERYAVAMEVAEEGHWEWNVQTDEIFASAQAKRVMNVPEDAEYRTRSDIMAHVRYHPDDWPRISAEWRAALAGRGVEHEFEYRILRGEEPRSIRGRWKVFRDATGVAQRVIGVVADITDRKLAEDELRESEARFRALTELSSDWYWRQDENLRFTYWSDDWAGYPGGAIGKTRWELEGVTLLSGSWAEHQAVLAARQRFRDLEYSRVAADGTIRYVSVSGAPVFDEQGRFKGYQGIARDITERKRIEEELRSRQEMLDLAQKSARAIAFEWKIGEGEGENRWSSDLEAMYGFAPGTYDGTFETWNKCVHPEDWPAVREALRHAHRTGDVASEYRVVHPDGLVHWLQARGRMFFGPDGKPARMVGFMQDITQRKQAEEELRKMEQELRRAQRLEGIGTLAGGIAHDFNNILGAILGYGEMAMRDAKKGTRLCRDLDSIMAAGERGRALVDRILAFSRSGVGERVPVHVEAVVREALDQVAASLPESVTIRPRLHAGRAAMLGDSTQVHQVVMNLASNAVQAMPQGGMLGVALETARFDSARPATVGSIVPGDYIVLRVSDTGTGIPDDVLERMFDPFFTTKEVGVGSGLGLSLVHGIVTSVDGAIDVATELGKSTTFTVYLRRSGDSQEQRADEDLPLPRGEGQRVLVVDDEELLVRLATETLEELGYVALGFTSSAAALEAIRADPQRFDAMITDERMPGMTGSALIRQVRGIRNGIPIVLVTGFVGGGTLDRARDAGADEVLEKPLSARGLATSLARVLRF